MGQRLGSRQCAKLADHPDSCQDELNVELLLNLQSRNRQVCNRFLGLELQTIRIKLSHLKNQDSKTWDSNAMCTITYPSYVSLVLSEIGHGPEIQPQDILKSFSLGSPSTALHH